MKELETKVKQELKRISSVSDPIAADKPSYRDNWVERAKAIQESKGHANGEPDIYMQKQKAAMLQVFSGKTELPKSSLIAGHEGLLYAYMSDGSRKVYQPGECPSYECADNDCVICDLRAFAMYDEGNFIILNKYR